MTDLYKLEKFAVRWLVMEVLAPQSQLVTTKQFRTWYTPGLANFDAQEGCIIR
jgi:hypothetical protein